MLWTIILCVSDIPGVQWWCVHWVPVVLVVPEVLVHLFHPLDQSAPGETKTEREHTERELKKAATMANVESRTGGCEDESSRALVWRSAGWMRAWRMLLIKAEVHLLCTDQHWFYKRFELAKVTEKRPDFITAVQRSAALNNKVPLNPSLKWSPVYTYCYFKSLKSKLKIGRGGPTSAHRVEVMHLNLC